MTSRSVCDFFECIVRPQLRLIPEEDQPRGRLIVFSGIDGSGKSTQIDLATNYFAECGEESIILKQPTEWYRSHPETRRVLAQESKVDLHFLALFAAADRRLQLKERILPALFSGKHVLMDRYVFSTFAYFRARGLTDSEWLRSINQKMALPDFTVFIDVPVDLALNRVISRDGVSAKKEEQNLDTMNKVRNEFLRLPARYPIEIVDGTEPASKVHQEIMSALQSSMAKGRTSKK